MRILIVENEYLIASMYEQILEAEGHDVVCCANDLESAKALVVAHPRFDLALVDFHLNQGCSGIDVASFMIPLGTSVMFVSSNPDGCRAAMGTGALGCLQKPFRDKVLAATVSLIEMIIKGEKPTTLPVGLELYHR